MRFAAGERNGRVGADKMDETLRRGIHAWVDAVRCMTRALEFVVIRFADDEAVELCYRTTVSYHLDVLRILEGWAHDTTAAGTRPQSPMVRFSGFSEETARAIAPLIEVVLVHPPTFLPRARELGAEEAVNLYGLFHGGWLLYLCHPVWRKCPDLVPPGWDTEAFKATSDK